MTTVIFFGDRRKFSKRKRGSGIQDRIWDFEQVFARSLHNACYTVFSPFLTENLNSAKLM